MDFGHALSEGQRKAGPSCISGSFLIKLTFRFVHSLKIFYPLELMWSCFVPAQQPGRW